MIKRALIVVEIDYSGLIYLLARWQMGSPHRTIGHGQKMDGLATRVAVWRADNEVRLALFCRHPSFLTQSHDWMTDRPVHSQALTNTGTSTSNFISTN